jgi:mono/diheme cytochrome c family protein
MQCHGEKGDGQGYLYTSKKYMFPPGNLLLEKTKKRPDGEIYHIINVGINIMGAHASQISQEDRWRIVMYIRNDLQ